MYYYQRIEQKLKNHFDPIFLEIKDQSHLHAGHSGTHPDGETHFKIKLISDAFIGLSRLERQKKVLKILDDEIKEHIHAISLSLKTKEEA